MKRFLGRGYDPEDLFQIGVIGLMKAIDKFDLKLEILRYRPMMIPIPEESMNRVSSKSNTTFSTFSLTKSLSAPSQI